MLLTAPLITGVEQNPSDLFTPADYRKLELGLAKLNFQPADLLSDDQLELPPDVSVDLDRIKRLLARGFQLSQAIESWQARAIWIVSTWDSAYPKRLKMRLGSNAPALIYGFLKESNSVLVSWNTKSGGNRLILRFTDWI